MTKEQLKQYLKDSRNYLKELSSSTNVPLKIILNNLIAALTCTYAFDIIKTDYIRNLKKPLEFITVVYATDYFCLGTLFAVLVGSIINTREYSNMINNPYKIELENAKRQMELSRAKLLNNKKI